MMRPPRPTYAELVSQLQCHDQWNALVPENNVSTLDPLNGSNASYAFIGQKQQGKHFGGQTRGEKNLSSPFTSNGRGFQAQGGQHGNHTSHINNGSRRPAPPGCRRMTPNEREMYLNEVCTHCKGVGHIAKICWWLQRAKQQQPEEIPHALAALTLDNTISETEWTADTGASNHMTGTRNRTTGDYRSTQG
ncbi:uncharacterized protein LOC119988529 [Tripterygium wilfordii]|uniref:uncharacterized protein LOC119988529 n=1 Tax=Tripterygium wilfordii TaxID=458696 RepID=UPI0018F7FD00|nr:uncharacterized protein LOC119988529 [Tripterygium wilfordii]